MLHLFISTFQASIKSVVCNIENEDKDVSFSRMEGAKIEGCRFVHDVTYVVTDIYKYF